MDASTSNLNNERKQGVSQSGLRVLVVEDSLLFAELLIAKLQRGLARMHDVHHVDHVADAVNWLVEEPCDLVILDMNLPDSSGLPSFESVYAVAPDVPIVIVSSDETEQLAMRAVAEGAEGYLIKGEDDTHKLMWSIRFAIERKKRLHAESELRAARHIQESLLPEKNPTIPGFDIHGAMFPAVETAGDYFDFISPMPAISDEVSGIVVGDVSGHGLGPAMVMAETRGCLHAFALLEPDLAKLLQLTNEVLVRNRNEHFVTLLLGYIDPISHVFRYASAGHQGWHVSHNGRITELKSTGTVLGTSLRETWQTETSPPLVAGDFLILMTDGITESMNPEGEMFGNARFFDFLQRHQSGSSEEIIECLREELIAFTAARPALDDMTIVIAKATAA